MVMVIPAMTPLAMTVRSDDRPFSPDDNRTAKGSESGTTGPSLSPVPIFLKREAPVANGRKL